jgi:Na+-transporting NADH:ubiquinone oxidoreductase subunit NqrF
LKNLFSIPYSYITSIQNQNGKNEIKIFYGNGSEDELILNDENIKKEIFDFLKKDLPNFKYSSELPSVLKYAKPQFFALLFTTLLFIWSLYLAIQIESGSEYEIVGGGRGIASIVLAIANLGTFKNIMGYIVLLGIILLSLTVRLKSRSETEFLER